MIIQKKQTINNKNLIVLLICLAFFLPISIVAQTEQTMYWVGGPGNWEDLSHWSFQSGGGGSLPSSIPTRDTHVVIDAGSGFKGGTLASRLITLNTEHTIKSLTFADDLTSTTSPRITRAGNYNLRVNGDVTLQPYGQILLYNTHNLIMEPAEGETSTLTLNGSQLYSSFTKKGAGTLNIVGEVNSSYNMYFQGGIVNYDASSFYVYDTSATNDCIVNMPNVITFTSKTGGGMTISGTGVYKMPRCETLSVYMMTLTSLTPWDLPSLKTFDIGYSMYNGNVNSTINLPDGTKVKATSWNFLGHITPNPNKAEFEITNGSFFSKNGQSYYKVRFTNPATKYAQIEGSCTIEELTSTRAGFYVVGTPLTIGTWTFAPSVTNIIFNGRTVIVQDDIIDTTPECEPHYRITTDTPGGTATIKKESGTVNLTNALISRINATGGAIFNVDGIDGGYNSGWNFKEQIGKDLYWVGDANDNEWNNMDNWSDTSGGTGGYCLPTKLDNVIFDKNSIISSEIKITTNPAYFHDIHIQDDLPNTDLTFILTSMNCYGSWYMKAGITINSNVLFYSYPGEIETITSNGSTFNIMYLIGAEGAGGTWILADDLRTIGDLQFRGGTFNTNDKDIYLGVNFNSNVAFEPSIALGGQRTLILGSSKISYRSIWRYSGTLDAGTSHITARGGADYNPEFTSNNSHIYYDVSFIPESTSIGTAKLSNILTFNKLTINTKKATINNNIQANVIDLGPNIGVTVASGKTITVIGDFITNTPDCSGLMEIAPSSSTSTFNLIKTTGVIHIPNVSLKGVQASGGATFSYYGLDEGGNSDNWIYTPVTAKDLYWIGTAGDGLWNTGSNWTTNNDGTPSESSCVPTQSDNVHFNSYSGSDGQIISLGTNSAYFNNFIAHDNAPVNIKITATTTGFDSYCYGNFIQLGEGMYIERCHLMGDVSNGKIINRSNSYFNNLTVSNTNAQWEFSGDMRISGTYMQSLAKQVDINMTTFTGGNILVHEGILNLNLKTLNGSSFELIKGIINASGVTMRVSKISSTGSDTSSLPRHLNIENATITTTDAFSYYGHPDITLNAANSHILVGKSFYGLAGHVYNKITTYNNNLTSMYIRGGITANEVILNHGRQILDNNTFGKLILMPKGLTLYIGAGTTQTITEDLILNGTPCTLNTIRAGTETGGTQLSATATIHYLKTNNHNRYDYTNIGGIIATGANLEFDVNTSNYGLNNEKVVFLEGAPGIVGLPDNFTCKTFNQEDVENEDNFISAEGFYGGPLSTYKWYYKHHNEENFKRLGIDSTTVVIDPKLYGINGTYKVEVVYDSTVFPICYSEDEIKMNYAPIIGSFTEASENKPHILNVNYCETDLKQLSYLVYELDEISTNFLENTEDIRLFFYETETSNEPLDPSTIMTEKTYYISFSDTISSCESPQRAIVNVSLDKMPLADAGPDINQSGKTFTMAGNQPGMNQQGEWTVISGDVTIADPTLYNTQVTLSASTNFATLEWRVANGTCIAKDRMNIGEKNYVPVNPHIMLKTKGN